MTTVILFIIFIGSLIMTFKYYWREQKMKDLPEIDETAIDKQNLSKRGIKRRQKKLSHDKKDFDKKFLRTQQLKKIWGTVAVFAFLIMLLVSPLNFDR